MSEINVDFEDEEFLAEVAAAEAIALSAKRRKTTATPTFAATPTASSRTGNDEGAYTAVLRGSRSINFQQQFQFSKPHNNALPHHTLPTSSITNNNAVPSGGGGDSCFKCGKSGHWARDCNAAAAASVDPDKACPCGLGACLVLTAKTDKNSGRKFYKCPLRQENGGCGFFEWCDQNSGTDNMNIRSQTYSSNLSSFPELSCPCGVGPCLILTAKTGKNIGQQFYRCPSSQGSCGFFKWCSDQRITDGFSDSVNSSRIHTNLHDMSSKNRSTSGSSCFKCGMDGHWAKDCPQSSLKYSSNLGGQCASQGTCYKCGKPGHWAKDCSSSGNTRARFGQ